MSKLEDPMVRNLSKLKVLVATQNKFKELQNRTFN